MPNYPNKFMSIYFQEICRNFHEFFAQNSILIMKFYRGLKVKEEEKGKKDLFKILLFPSMSVSMVLDVGCS